MNICEQCNETFYSDTEFREHRLFHLMEKVLQVQTEGIPTLAQNLGFVGSEIRLHLLYMIMARENISFEEAIKKYLTFGAMFNKMLDIHRKGEHELSIYP